jgi:hypothetical protein
MSEPKPAQVIVWGEYPKGRGPTLKLTGAEAQRLAEIVKDSVTRTERRRAWVKAVLKGLREAQRWAEDRDRLAGKRGT